MKQHCHHCDSDTDADWKTVTTDLADGRGIRSNRAFGNEAGSSLADVSVPAGDDFDSYAASTNDCTGCSQCHNPFHAPEEHGNYDIYADRSSAPFGTKEPVSPSLSAIQKFSKILSDDYPNDDSWDSQNAYELQTLRRIHHDLLSDHDDGMGTSPASDLAQGFAPRLPQLPFPLISLPEAAKRQQRRRESGEEDHTEAGVSFHVKSRSVTGSTASSTQAPRTPLSTYFDWHSNLELGPMKPPAMAHLAPKRGHEVQHVAHGQFL